MLGVIIGPFHSLGLEHDSQNLGPSETWGLEKCILQQGATNEINALMVEDLMAIATTKQ